MENKGNDILFGKDAKKKVLKGIQILYDAVSTTLGPRGQNVGIDYGFEKKILHDGVSVAKVIMLKDLTENFGAQVVAEAARKQVDEVGDATTGTITLAYSIITEANKIIEAGVNPMQLRSELESASEIIIKEINKYAKPISTLEEKQQVATISAEDKELGNLVAETIEKTGANGLVSAEESTGYDTYYEWEEGMQFDKGFASPYFVTNPNKLEASLKDARILITDIPLTAEPLMPLFTEVFQKKGWPLVIIGPEITDNLRNFLIVNKLEGKISALYINAPMFGDRQNAFMQDIAIITGSTFISREAGMSPEKITAEHLGKATRVRSTQTVTEIIGGAGDKKMIADRIALVKEQLADETSEFEKTKLKERIAKMAGGVSVIKVGGQTEIEMKERKERVDDAVHALKAALEEGIVPGGETVFLRAIEKLPNTGYGNIIMKEALKLPFKKLMENAGYDSGQMLERISTSMVNGYGIDVTTGKVVNMFDSGIVDPKKVVVQALRNALSVAVQIICMPVVITPNIELKPLKQ